MRAGLISPFLFRLHVWAAVLMAAACASLPPVELPPGELPTRAEVQGVPLIVQRDFFCGPASLAMVQQWARQDVTQEQVAALAFSPGARGTYLADMLGAARRQGMLAVVITTLPQVMAEIDAGHPVIVFQNLGLAIAPVWHYGVVTGYDLEKDEFYLNSGRREKMVMPTDLLRRTWARGDNWALVVLPPDRLPASAGATLVLQATAALERVGQHGAAARAYRAGAKRWSDQWLWPFGLGNALYAQGDRDGALRAWRQAQGLAPDVPEIANNIRELSG